MYCVTFKQYQKIRLRKCSQMIIICWKLCYFWKIRFQMFMICLNTFSQRNSYTPVILCEQHLGNANRQIKKSKERKKIRSCRAWISNNTYIIITASRSLLWISNKVVSISCIHLHFLFFVRSLLLFGNHWIHTTQKHCMCVGWDNVVKSAERICAVDTAQ